MEQEEKIARVADNFRLVKERVAEAAELSGRSPKDVRLVCVTKFVDIPRIGEAIAAGGLEVGENRAQELVDKYDFFKENGQTVHFIGQLQLNKVKYLIGRADLIQSADRIEAFSEIERLAGKHGIRQNTLVEVNIGNEPQKGGIAPEELRELLKRISDMPHVCVKGLMCIPPAAGGEDARYYFKRMKELFENIKAAGISGIDMELLSMGMSGDYPSAIAEGANMVRIGSAIFGARPRH
ncbi:MAG: YggS family pyridoxal phosphate-dependent enzyme [Clostridiales bacterium]|nr:YggS family pyridoxal phosphate-dependent enzyme [Clostridiales bacterium]